MSDWQPIDAAPKDGTRVLVVESRSYGRAYYEAVQWSPDDVDGAWVSDDGDYYRADDFTHWMPLPPPPPEPAR